MCCVICSLVSQSVSGMKRAMYRKDSTRDRREYAFDLTKEVSPYASHMSVNVPRPLYPQGSHKQAIPIHPSIHSNQHTSEPWPRDSKADIAVCLTFFLLYSPLLLCSLPLFPLFSIKRNEEKCMRDRRDRRDGRDGRDIGKQSLFEGTGKKPDKS